MKYKSFYRELLKEGYPNAHNFDMSQSDADALNTNKIDEAAPCWDGYVQYGMKMKNGKQVPNCVPATDESLLNALRTAATAKKSAQTSLAKPKPATTSLSRHPAAAPISKPEPKTYEVPTSVEPDTAQQFKARLAAAVEKRKKQKLAGVDEATYNVLNMLRNKKTSLTPPEQKPDFKSMSPEQRREYMGHKAEREQPAVPLDLLAKAGKGGTGDKARYALSTPMTEDDIDEYCPHCMMEVLKGMHKEQLGEADYQGRKVQLGKPMQGDVKKFKVFVKDPNTGNVKKVNFGDKTMKIKKSNPARRKSFRARHHCDTNPGPRTKARYWSCRKW